MALPPARAVEQWRVADRRGFALLGLLTAAGGVLGLWQGHLTNHHGWLIGGLLLLGVWPYTLLVIMPTKRLLMTRGMEQTARAVMLLDRWSQLHGVRTAMGLAAIVAYVAGFLG